VILAGVLALSSGCSVRGAAVDTIGDMLATDQSVFTEDDDVELIGGALPFSLKLVDSLLAESPEHRGLLLTAARGYVFYSYAYVQFPAEQIADVDLGEARILRARARKLYMRGFDYALRGLEVDYPGFGQALAKDPTQATALISAEPEDNVAFLYWAASALGLAISVSKDDPALLARLPEVEALLERALALDEAFDDGALHEFAIIWSGATPGARDTAEIERHYARALELSDGNLASVYIAYAMATALPAQDREKFTALMDQALAVDPDALPEKRLLNVIAQRRARWLMARVDEFFLE
jgi:predicted anti-sigma-YlaC factor YlaD